jgi:hypothetical protein
MKFSVIALMIAAFVGANSSVWASNHGVKPPKKGEISKKGKKKVKKVMQGEPQDKHQDEHENH